MMKESKLTTHQQKVLRESMSTGSALPALGPAPASYKRTAKAPARPPPSVPWQDPFQGVAFNANMTQGMGRKPQQQIHADSRGYARDMFVGGGRVVDREKEKEALIDKFAYGEHTPVRAAPVRKPPPVAPSVPAKSEVEVLHEKISLEITERQVFVLEMRTLGNREHEQLIQGEIAERIRQLRTVEQMMKDWQG
ncbi:hypothetical protein T492DRAFT_922020 [Pavlovales sp. CCMP2436]|nr:hypothetical protein T492DRAFT_922020 [Pavlovales sp. CCMP2436]